RAESTRGVNWLITLKWWPPKRVLSLPQRYRLDEMLPQWSYSRSATTLLPGQDKSVPSGPMSGASWFVVSCGVRLSVCGSGEIRKPQVRFLSYQSNSLNFKTQKRYQRRLDRLPYTARIERPSSFS